MYKYFYTEADPALCSGVVSAKTREPTICTVLPLSQQVISQMSSSNPTWRRVNHKVQCLVGMKTCRLSVWLKTFSHQPLKGQLSTISEHLGQYYYKNKPIQVAG